MNISQSMIKSVISDHLEVNCCWRQFHNKYILKKESAKSSIAMDRGGYFESGCIGSTVTGEVVTELPLARGKKSVVTERIDSQVDEFHRMCKILDIDPNEGTQFKIKLSDNDGFTRVGTLDWFPVTIFGKKCIVDLKLTENLDVTISPYGWGIDENCKLMVDEKTGVEYYVGTPYSIDSIQSDFYIKLVKRVYGDDVEFVYWVFEHGKKKRNRIFFAKQNQDLTEIRVSSVKSMINTRQQSGIWEEVPYTARCKRCKILDCKHNLCS